MVAEGLELADVGPDRALGAAALVVMVGAEIDELRVRVVDSPSWTTPNSSPAVGLPWAACATTARRLRSPANRLFTFLR